MQGRTLSAESHDRPQERFQANNETTVARLLVDKGYRLCQEGAIDEGLLWMVRALENCPQESAMATAIRMNIATWKRYLLLFEGGIAGDLSTPFAISPDSRRLAAVSGSSVHVYSTETGDLLKPSCEFDGYCESLRFTSPDTLLIAVRPEASWMPSTPAVVMAWDCTEGVRIVERRSVLPLLFDRLGQQVMLRTEKSAQLCQAKTLEIIGAEFSLPESPSGFPVVAGLAPDGHHFASIVEGKLHIWNTKSGDPMDLPNSNKPVNQFEIANFVWSSSGKNLAVVMRDVVVSWNLQERSCVRIEPGNFPHVGYSDDERFLGVLEEHSFRLFRAGDGSLVGELVLHATRYSDGRQMARLSNGPDIMFVDVTPSRVTVKDRDGMSLFSINRPSSLLSESPLPSPVDMSSERIDRAHEHRYDWSFGKIIDMESGQTVGQTLQAPLASTIISDAIFAPTSPHVFTLVTGDGKSLFSTPRDRVAIGRWRLPHPSESKPISGSPLAVSDRGQFVLVLEEDEEQRIQLWDVETLSRKGASIQGEPFSDRRRQPIAAIAPEGEAIAVLRTAQGNAPTIQVFLKGESNPAHEFKLSGERGIRKLLFAPDGKELLAVGYSSIYRIDADSWRMLGSPLQAQVGNPASNIEFDPLGRTFVVLYGQESQLWSRATGEPIGQVFDRWRGVDEAKFHPEGKFFVTNDIVDSILFDAESGGPLSHGRATVYPENSSLQLLKEELPPKYPLLNDEPPFRILDFDISGARMAATDGALNGPFVQIRNAHTGQPIGPRLRHAANVSEAMFSPDGVHLATLAQGVLRIWNTETSQPVAPPCPIGATMLAFSSDSTLLATDNHLWHVATGVTIGPSVVVSDCQVVRFTPQGRRVIRIGRDVDSFGPTMMSRQLLDVQEIPSEEPGEVNAIRANVELITGRRLDPFGATWPIDPSEIPAFTDKSP